jgi:hypothetical protein
VLDQVEERRLAPLDVVEDHDERAVECRVLEHLPHRPGDLGRRRDRLPLAEESGDRPPDGVVVRQFGELLDHLDDWPVRDSLAVREAAPVDDASTIELSEELGHQP